MTLKVLLSFAEFEREVTGERIRDKIAASKNKDIWMGRGSARVSGRQSPHSSPGQTTPSACAAVEGLRRRRHTGAQIAAEVGVSAATVSRILKRRGLNRLSAIEPAAPVRRDERAALGEIIPIDIKKLGKFNRIGHRIPSDRAGQSNPHGVGGEHVRWRSTTNPVSPIPKSCRTKNVNLACAFSSMPCASFEALRFFRNLGVKVERAMTDNGSSFRSPPYAKATTTASSSTVRTVDRGSFGPVLEIGD